MMDHQEGQTLYVSPAGNDAWSGLLEEPNVDGTDGPLATMERARDRVRGWKLTGRLTGPVTVYLRGGRYHLEQPMVFRPEDSGPITYAAYPGEQPILDAGRRIEGWRVETRQLESGKEITVWVTELPDVAAGKWAFRQLFVNGERRSRPRLPKEDFYWMEDVPGLSLDGSFTGHFFDGTDTFVAAPGDVQGWHNLTDVEVVAVHYWIEERMPIATFDPETSTVTSSRRSMFILRDDVAQRYAKYFVENVYEALSEPGEWYLDRTTGELTYVPMPGEDPDTAEVFAPVTAQFLRLSGDPDSERYVEYLRFVGLGFEHSRGYLPPGGGERFGLPDVDLAASPQAAAHLAGAIRLEGARYCAFEDCAIRHVGWYGVELAEGCTGNRIVGNDIGDLGGGGVKLDGADAKGPVTRRTGNNVITDNHIHAGGRIFYSAVGVLSIHAYGNDISHNHIHDLYYSGVSCGWVWGYAENVSKNNRIEKNHIHDLGHGLLSDMGGIYTLGVQPGTVLRGNLIHDIEKCNYGGWCIYLDEGSSHILVENNVCYQASTQAFNQHYGRENIVRNNIWAFGEETQVSLGRIEAHNSFNFERNIVVGRGRPMFRGRPRDPKEKPGFWSDLNLFWDVEGDVEIAVTSSYDAQAQWQLVHSFSWDDWRAFGNDRHSRVADPCFKDLEAYDFEILPDSPALELGFEPIDLSDVGPRPKSERDQTDRES
ncbi:MAG: right-handed parallel beta-helix repeat-containing protein [Anaerolineae bacterium]